MHRVRTVLFTGLIAAAAVIGPVGESHAAPQVCAGTARLWTSQKMTLTGAPVNATFALTWVDGADCPDASGTLVGNCADISGSGKMGGHTFNFQSVGTTMLFSGSLAGTLERYREEPLPCNSPADTFRLAGVLVRQ